MTDPEPSYIDYEAFLDPTFSPTSFANALVTATNNASDTPLDLSTPLSRVLFDVQEIDTHIDTLTTKSALPLLTHTKAQTDASQRIVKDVDAQVANLTRGYERLEKEVIQRYETAEEVRIAVERLWQTVKIGKTVQRCLLLGRQLEAQMAELSPSSAGNRKEDHRALTRATNSILALRIIYTSLGPGQDGEYLSRINNMTTLQSDLIMPADYKIRARAQQIIREFSMSSLVSTGPTGSGNSAPPTYSQTEETKARTTSACQALYLLSPLPAQVSNFAEFQPTLLLAALQSYLQTALTSSLASVARALNTLPTLNRTLLEVSARCQNVIALEALLESIKPPAHPQLDHLDEMTGNSVTMRTDPNVLKPETSIHSTTPPNLLVPLLTALDTSSLPSYFWRSLASGLSNRVQDIVLKGGAGARTLRSQRDKVRESIRECVIRGCQIPAGIKKSGGEIGWDREVGVMVASVTGPLGR
ncbi:hypothetical protein MMC09_004279 [Bachmanniomyces sp. S44760]|nr:hypothetical protein [Bachmanniomyces sp. S44760]